MKRKRSLQHGHRFPAEVISQAVRWYFSIATEPARHRGASGRAWRGRSYETIRRWCDNCGASFAHRAKIARRKPGSTRYLDEMFVTLRGESYLLWRAVDQHGAELDVLVQKRRDKVAAKRFVLAACTEVPRKIVTRSAAQLSGRESRDRAACDRPARFVKACARVISRAENSHQAHP